MEDMDDQEELLNLSLATVSNYDHHGGINRMKKRKGNRTIDTWEEEGCEGKVYSLLQMREEMLKTEITHNGTKHRRKEEEEEEEEEEDRHGLHLIHSLLIASTAVNENNVSLALENLTKLYQSVSLSGDSVQRVVAYFADGLSARLLTRKSPFYDMIMKKPSEGDEFRAFTNLYGVSPYYQFAHFTANQAIMEAFERDQLEERNHCALHVIDFDVSYGFQWPSLMQSLSDKATGINGVSLRITAFGRNLEELHETENRLVQFSKGFKNLVFEFHGLPIIQFKLLNLRKRKHETLVVNLFFHPCSYNYTQVSETLNSIRILKPSIVTLLEQEGRPSAQTFLSRFMESLHYFAAMFDSLDDCLPLESTDRLNIEKNHLGREIKWILNHDTDDSIDGMKSHLKYDKLETWKARMESHGFAGIKLSSKSLIQAKLLLKIRAQHGPLQLDGENGGFRVIQRDEGKALSLGWQDRSLITASAWQCDR